MSQTVENSQGILCLRWPFFVWLQSTGQWSRMVLDYGGPWGLDYDPKKHPLVQRMCFFWVCFGYTIFRHTLFAWNRTIVKFAKRLLPWRSNERLCSKPCFFSFWRSSHNLSPVRFPPKHPQLRHGLVLNALDTPTVHCLISPVPKILQSELWFTKFTMVHVSFSYS